MLAHVLKSEIRELIEARDFTTMREVFSELLPLELAELVEGLPESEAAIIFRLLPQDLAADTFEYLEVEQQVALVKALAQEQVVGILNDMAPDDRTALFEELPGDVTKLLVAQLSPEERSVAQNLLGYPEYSVGRLMTPDFVAVRAEWTVKDVLDYVRKYGHDSETLNLIYVVNERGRLLDDVRIREFLLAPLEHTVRDLMDDKFAALTVSDDQETAVARFKEYDLTALPVVDSSGILVGIVTVDDVLDVAEEEATEDIQKFGGMEALDEPYATSSLFDLVKKRGTWLVVLFIGEMLTATAAAYFEDEIAKAVVLALFIPLIISSGGNSGSQAATLIIRALTVNEISLSDWWFVMKREIISGLMLGTLLGTIGFMRIALWSVFSPMYGPHWLLIGFTVAFSLVFVVLFGTISGSMLPLILKRLGADPATSSAPFVATLVDVTGLVIYFSFASMILHGTLL